jgi:hypothetical protein
MRRGDWKPALLLAVGSAAILFTVLTLAGPWLRGRLGGPPLPDRPMPDRAPSVDLWVGDLATGVKGVLTANFNDPVPDAEQDGLFNRGLGLDGGRALAYYQFHVFNVSDRPFTVRLTDGELVVTPKGGEPLPMRSLKTVLAGGAGLPAPSVADFLSKMGSNREAIEVPPGKSAHPFVAFPRRVALGEVVAVAGMDGTEFHRRPIPRAVWEDLRTSTSLADLKGL